MSCSQHPVGTILTLGFHEECDPSPERLREVLANLEEYGCEDAPGAILTCARTEWSLGALSDGLAVWMNQSYNRLGYGHPRQMRGVTRERVFELWNLLAAGRIAEIEREPWQPDDSAEGE